MLFSKTDGSSYIDEQSQNALKKCVYTQKETHDPHDGHLDICSSKSTYAMNALLSWTWRGGTTSFKAAFSQTF